MLLVYLLEILGFNVHRKGVFDFDLAKDKFIHAMEPPVTCNKLKSFIPAFAELLESFHKLLKKNASFELDEEKQKAV